MPESKYIKGNNTASITVGAVDSVAFTAFYAMYATEFLKTFLTNVAKYYLFPINMAASLIQATLAWRHAYLERNEQNNVKTHLVVRAGLATIGALTMSAAVVGGLVFSTVFGAASSIIFAAGSAFQTLANVGMSIFYAGKAAAAPADHPKKQIYKDRAIDYGMQAAAGVVATVASTLILVLGKAFLFPIGVAAGAFGGGLLVKKTIDMCRKPSGYEPLASDEDDKKKNAPHTDDAPSKRASTSVVNRALASRAITYAPRVATTRRKTCTKRINSKDIAATNHLLSTQGAHTPPQQPRQRAHYSDDQLGVRPNCTPWERHYAHKDHVPNMVRDTTTIVGRPTIRQVGGFDNCTKNQAIAATSKGKEIAIQPTSTLTAALR